ncbi:MAG TPA: PAS domain-containing protein [Candidatus Omnitrophota bacterium]|nr:PAS domain-containing protein [Candidatus Omnitrophota bacterium]
MRNAIIPTGKERMLHDGEIIVSKTDLKGRIQYANDTFLRISGFLPQELVGAPHNVIRHPDMPRCVFKLLWDTIQAKGEIFAYVVNISKNGDHYWVLAHVTPSFDRAGAHIGYHSNRRKPERGALRAIEPLYRTLRAIERRAGDPRQGLADAAAHLNAILAEKGMAYDQFVFSL